MTLSLEEISRVVVLSPEADSLKNKVLALQRLVIKARMHKKVENFC